MSCAALRLLLLLSLALAPLTGCGGCSDEVEPDPTPAPSDMSDDASPPDDMDRPDGPGPADMAQDMDADMKADPPDLPEFDFGVEDMPVAQFALIDVVPPSGPVAGGARVRVRGSAIPSGSQVFFGAQPLESPIYETAGVIGRTPPAAGPGPVSVKVIATDGRVKTLEGAYTYLAPLRIDAVTPSRVPTAGGVEVEVRGQGFGADTSSVGVTFSGTSALRVELLSDGLLRVVTPPRPAGLADVRVVTPAGAATAPGAVSYFTPLSISAVEPASGLSAGGEEVVVRGEGFVTGMEVRFGGLSAPILQVNAQAGEARVRTPAHPVGLVDVSASAQGESALLQRAFYYRDGSSPLLAALAPESGSSDGGQLVRLIGVGLDRPAARFTFDGQPAMIVSQSASAATVRTPAGAPGAVDVSFFDGAQLINTLPDAYTYVEAIHLDAVSPSSGPVAGGQQVTLTGRGLDGASRVTFGGLPAQIISAQETQLRVVTPAHSEGAVAVAVERGGLVARLADAYTYEGPLVIWGFTPVRGAVAGGTYVEVRGQGFGAQGAITVTLGGRAGTQVRRIDSHTLSLLTPPGPIGEAQLVVSLAGRSAQGPYPYQYFEPAARFGGASGSSIDGAVNVTVYSTAGAPIKDAFVMLSTRPDTRYQGLTNAAGQITLSGPEVLGEQTVSATAAGYSTASVQAVDAENITLFLNQLDPTPAGGGGGGAPPPSAIIRGRVSSPGKLANPDDQLTYDMAIVRTTSPSPYGGNPSPGAGSVVIGDGNYQIITRVGDMAVVATCGVYNERTQVFDPQYLGVVRYLQVSDQQTLNVDVVCDIPLDQSLPVKLVNPIYSPEGPNINVVDVVWNFGFEGYFASPSEGRGLSSLLTVGRQPALTGPLSDVTLMVTGGSFTGDYAPLTQSARADLTSSSQLIQLPPLLDVPELVSPADGGVIVNGEIRWQVGGAYRPDLISIVMRDARGIPVWSIMLPGDATSARIPTFPDLSSLPIEIRPQPYPRDLVYLTISSARVPGATFDAFTYQDLESGRWEAYSLNRWTVQFPPP